MPPDAVANLFKGHRRGGPQTPVIGGQQFVVVRAPILRLEGAAQEIGDVGQGGAPGDRLPVHHRQVAQRTGPPEQHVVQSVVAMHQAFDPPVGILGGHIVIEAVHQALTDQALLGGDGVCVAVGEPGEQPGDHRLVHRTLPVEPVRLGQGLVADQRAVQPAQLGHGQHRVFGCGAADLIAHLCRGGIVEQQGEHAAVGLIGGVIALGDRAAQPRRQLGVEPHFAFVESQRLAGLPTHRVAGGDFKHDRFRTAAVLVAQRDPVALAHLAGADALDGEPTHPAGPQVDCQPPRGEVGGPFYRVLAIARVDHSTNV